MSSINPNNIDGTYPIAGQDNDSQGFRDNFTNIKNNFTFAASELADLQNNAILKSALSGTTLNNNLNNSQLIGAQISKFTETRIDVGTQTGAITINWSDAHFQTVTTSGSLSPTFTNWPTSGFWTSFKLEITVSDSSHTITLPASVTVNNTNIQGINNNVITFPAAGTYLLEFSTYDGGTTVTVRDLLRNYAPVYQYYNPSGNVAITANVNVNRVILAPVGTISFGAKVTLPNAKVNGTTISISSNVGTTLGIVAPWLTSINPSANVQLSAGSSATYLYRSADNNWYKVN